MDFLFAAAMMLYGAASFGSYFDEGRAPGMAIGGGVAFIVVLLRDKLLEIRKRRAQVTAKEEEGPPHHPLVLLDWKRDMDIAMKALEVKDDQAFEKILRRWSGRIRARRKLRLPKRDEKWYSIFCTVHTYAPGVFLVKNGAKEAEERVLCGCLAPAAPTAVVTTT